MTKFNAGNKDTLTYGECLDPAMKITNAEDAQQYKRDYIAYIQKHLEIEPSTKGQSAEEIVNINLGYYAGYFDNKTRARVEKLFLCEHPIFGSIERNGIPSGEEAFHKGLAIGKGGLI